MKFKVLSWNIWIKGYFAQVAKFLEASEADIIGLQEVLPDDSDRDAVGFLSKLGYQHAFAPVRHTWKEEVYNDGPAIFSKYKILGKKTYLLSKKDPRAAVRADIQVGDKVLHVFSTHLVHTHQKPSKVQDEQGLNLIDKLPAERTILMGDFNATPQSSVIRNVQKVLVDSDPFSQPTWSMYPEGCLVCNPQGLHTRLDYIFTTKDMKTSSFKVEKSKGSDHLPISVFVET